MIEHLQKSDQQFNRQKRNNTVHPSIWKQLYMAYREEIDSIVSYLNILFTLKFVNQDRISTSITHFTNMSQYYKKWIEYLFIYSDGSRSPSGVGTAIYDPKHNYH